jgi:hypothetical protein
MEPPYPAELIFRKNNNFQGGRGLVFFYPWDQLISSLVFM